MVPAGCALIDCSAYCETKVVEDAVDGDGKKVPKSRTLTAGKTFRVRTLSDTLNFGKNATGLLVRCLAFRLRLFLNDPDPYSS